MEPCSERKYVKPNNYCDEADSVPQIALSERSQRQNTMGSFLKNMWTGQEQHSVFQYPHYEWIPKSIFYAEYCRRMTSFDNWPKQMRPSPKDLVESGFFYKGYGDSVECFFCEICLHDWELKNSATGEHRKWSPFCKYVKMNHF